MEISSKIKAALTEKDSDSVSMPFWCRSVIIVLIIGMAARLLLGVFMTHIYDMYHWGVVIQNIYSGNGLYELTGYFYTPVWGYFLGLEAVFQDLMGVTDIGGHITEAFPMENIAWYYISTVTTPAFNISLKLIFLISDIVVGYLIFWLIRDITKDGRKAMIGFALWFLCPFVISAGSVIGMFDTLSVLMTLVAVIMLRKQRYLESGVMLCIATLTKFFPGFFILIFIAYIMAKENDKGAATKGLAMFLAGIAVTGFVIFLPQLLDGTIADTFLFITSRLNEGTGFDDIGSIGGYVAVIINILALAVSAVFAMRIKRKGDTSDRLLFDAMLVTTAVMFLYPPLPQYVLMLLPFILFAMLYNKRYWIPCCILFIGTSMASLAGGFTDLVAIAAFTDLMDLDSLMGIINGYTTPYSGSPMMIIGTLGSVIQYIGILSVLWIRYGERIKGMLRRRSDESVPE